MRRIRASSFRRLTTAAVVLAVSGAAVVGLSGGVANGQPAPTPLPTPVPVVMPTLTLTANPPSPQIEGTKVRVEMSADWPYPLAGRLVADNTVLWTGQKGHGPGRINGVAEWTPTVGQHRLEARADPTYCPISSGVICRGTSAELTYVVNAPTPTPGATATTTTLTVTPSGPVPRGTPVSLLANVAPAAATGTVQFKDGNRNIGGPVPVLAGFAFRITTLDDGQRTITASSGPPTRRASAHRRIPSG